MYSSTILDLGTRQRWVVSSTPRPLYSLRNRPWYPLERRLVGPQSRSGRRGEQKISFCCHKSEPGCLHRSPSLCRLSYPGLQCVNNLVNSMELIPSWEAGSCDHSRSYSIHFILSTHLSLGFPTGLFPSGFPTNNLYASSFVLHALPISSSLTWLF
jgi:hypothetical protein